MVRIHVYLEGEAAENALLISKAWNRSVGNCVNILLSHIAAADLSEELSVTVKRDADVTKPNESKVKVIKHKKSWVTDW